MYCCEKAKGQVRNPDMEEPRKLPHTHYLTSNWLGEARGKVDGSKGVMRVGERERER